MLLLLLLLLFNIPTSLPTMKKFRSFGLHSTRDVWKDSPFRTSTDQACILFIAVIKSCAQNVGIATFQVHTGGAPWEIKGFFGGGNGGISLVKGEKFEPVGHNFSYLKSHISFVCAWLERGWAPFPSCFEKIALKRTNPTWKSMLTRSFFASLLGQKSFFRGADC